MGTSIEELISELANRQAGSSGLHRDLQHPSSAGRTLFWAGALNLALILTGSWLLGQEAAVPSAHALLLFFGAVISFVNVCWLLYRLGGLQRCLAQEREVLERAQRELEKVRSRTREVTWDG